MVGLAIPISVIGTFLMLNLWGRSLNVISLAGMAFAVGMLVDNAVVVLENIYRHFQNGEAPFQAAVDGTKEVWGAVLASTLDDAGRVSCRCCSSRKKRGSCFATSRWRSAPRSDCR